MSLLAIPPASSSRLKHIAPLLTWLKLGVLFVILSVIALTGVTIHYSHDQYREQARITTQNLALALENQIAGFIEADEVALLAVMDEYQRQHRAGHFDGEIMNRYIQQVVSRHPEIDAIRIANADGALIAGNDVTPGVPTNIADRPHFIHLRDNPNAGLIFSRPQISRVNQKWVIVLARRINQADGSFGGMAFAAIALTQLSGSFSSFDIGRNGVITLRGEDMRLIARYPQVPLPNGAMGSTVTAPAFKEKISAGQTYASLMARSPLDGVERIYSYRRIRAHPLYIFVGLAPQDYLAEWRKTAIQQILMAGLFTLVITLAAFLMHRAWHRHFILSESLAESEARLRETIDSALDGVVSIDTSGRLIDFNPAAERIFGWKKEEILGQVMAEVLIPDQHRNAHNNGLTLYSATHEAKVLNQRIETTAMRKDGTLFPVELAITAIQRKEGEIFTAYLRDISRRKKMEEEVRQLAFFDPLTKLPNRRLLKDRLNQTMAANRRSGCFGAIIFLDLDNFKPLNDAHGHDVGDLLLIEVAKRLKNCVREMDTVSRFGGDEFVVILSELTKSETESASQARIVAEKIRDGISEPYLLMIKRAGEPEATIEHRCTASIGVALFDGDETSEEELLKWADMAMYQAKTTGNSFVFHDQ